MRVILETKRLRLQEFSAADAIHLFELNNDPEVLKFTGDLPFDSIENAVKFLANYSNYKKDGFGRWAVYLKKDNRFIGWCGFRKNEGEWIDLGFRFLKKEWGNGYATEAAKGCIEFGFNQLGIIEIVGRAVKDNLASIRVLEKVGMKYWKVGSCDDFENAAYFRIQNTDLN